MDKLKSFCEILNSSYVNLFKSIQWTHIYTVFVRCISCHLLCLHYFHVRPEQPWPDIWSSSQMHFALSTTKHTIYCIYYLPLTTSKTKQIRTKINSPVSSFSDISFPHIEAWWKINNYISFEKTSFKTFKYHLWPIISRMSSPSNWENGQYALYGLILANLVFCQILIL